MKKQLFQYFALFGSLLVFMLILFSSCDNKDKIQMGYSEMKGNGKTGLNQKSYKTEKIEIHGDGILATLSIFEIHQEDNCYLLFEKDDNIYVVDFVKDSLEKEFLKLQIKQLINGSSFNKEAAK